MAKSSAADTDVQYQALLAQMQSGQYKPCYLLMGEEPYYVDRLSEYIAQNTLPEDQQSFNQFVLYGNNATAAQVLDYARRYPMMADRQVVIVREAQQMKGTEVFASYFKAPNPLTVLVFCFMGKNVDKRSAFWKAAQSSCAILESNPLRDNQITGWITRYLSRRKIDIEPQAVQMMADFLGTELRRIAMEVDKLMLLLPDGTQKVTAAQVEQSVGINRDFSPFALFEYINRRDFAKIQPIVRYFGENSKTYPLVMLISLMYAHFSRILQYHCAVTSHQGISRSELASVMGINPYFLNGMEAGARAFSFAKTVQIIGLLCQYDSRYKSSDRGEATDGELLVELVCKIIN